MKICMAAAYNIKNNRSWSGTPLSLYLAMTKNSSAQIDTLDLTEFQTLLQLRINAIKYCDISESIRTKTVVSKLGPSALNPVNSKILSSHCSKKDYDVLFEFGGFLPHKNLPPYYVYTDSSHDLKLDYYKEFGYFPFGTENDSVESVKRAAEYAGEIYRNAQGVFCMSEWLANSMINTTGVSMEKVHTVYAGANWHGVELPANIKSKTIDGKKEIHMLLTGVSFKGKGVDIAIDAVKLLNKGSEKKYYLHVCGIKDEFEHDEYIINHGFIGKSNLINILQQCDLFVLPSRFDCFGISFVEALTFGLPCIGRKICAMPEIIDEGINGELITKDDPAELADLITKICENESLYKNYSVRAIEKAKKFTWDAVSERILKII